MTKQMASKAPEISLFDPFALCSGPMTDIVGQASEACLNTWRAWHEEASRFAARRLERDAELARRLLSCRDWSEALMLQQEWVATAAQDYVDQTRRLTEIAGRLASAKEARAMTALSRGTEAA